MDLISRQDAIDAIVAWTVEDRPDIEMPTDLVDRVNALPSAEQKGKWIEKHHAYSDEESVIEEWQSCRCSECGRYDTRPYMYSFSEPNYCSYCGADMRGLVKADIVFHGKCVACGEEIEDGGLFFCKKCREDMRGEEE